MFAYVTEGADLLKEMQVGGAGAAQAGPGSWVAGADAAQAGPGWYMAGAGTAQAGPGCGSRMRRKGLSWWEADVCGTVAPKLHAAYGARCCWAAEFTVRARRPPEEDPRPLFPESGTNCLLCPARPRHRWATRLCTPRWWTACSTCSSPRRSRQGRARRHAGHAPAAQFLSVAAPRAGALRGGLAALH